MVHYYTDKGYSLPKKNHEVLFVCQAEDKVGKNRRKPTLEEMTIIAGVDPEEELRKLHTRIEIAIGMKAMVTVNIATKAESDFLEILTMHFSLRILWTISDKKMTDWP